MISYLKGKNIALFGNASSVLDRQRPNIDNEHDVFVRLNKGTTKGKELYIGSKTDILGLSMNLEKYEIKALYPNLQNIVYCSTKNRVKLCEYLLETCKFYPEENWALLLSILGSRPSTGIMMIDYLYCNSEFAELHLYGFDFWDSHNTYTGVVHVGQHDPLSEKEYVELLIRNSDRIFYHE